MLDFFQVKESSKSAPFREVEFAERFKQVSIIPTVRNVYMDSFYSKSRNPEAWNDP